MTRGIHLLGRALGIVCSAGLAIAWALALWVPSGGLTLQGIGGVGGALMSLVLAVFAGIADAPTPGTTWRANCYRIDHADGGPRHLAWSPPPVADFHQLDSFGSITFTGRP